MEGALVVLDDYLWPDHPRDSAEHPAEGIDAFVNAHRHELEVVHKGYQLVLRRTVPEFRGFAWANATSS